MAKKAAAKSEVPTIERKIVFFRAACGEDDAGKPLPFNPAPVLKHVHALPFDDGRYLTLSGGQLATVWVDKSTMPCRLRIANVRRSGLPAVEQAGKLSPLRDSGRFRDCRTNARCFFSRQPCGRGVQLLRSPHEPVSGLLYGQGGSVLPRTPFRRSSPTRRGPND